MRRGVLLGGSVAGIAGGVAYLAAMKADLALTENDTDDLVMLGGLFTTDRRAARRLGVAMHACNSMVAGIVYAGAARDLLPGPEWLRGTAFAIVENTALYPLALLEDLHPAIREGRLARYWTWTSFLQGTGRHVAFGAVMGVVYSRLRVRQPL